MWQRCPICEGEGTIFAPPGLTLVRQTCPTCNGARVLWAECPTCKHNDPVVILFDGASTAPTRWYATGHTGQPLRKDCLGCP